MGPVDVQTGHTLAFVCDALPASAQRVLEVGAGAEHLAHALRQVGHSVVAIDASERAVERARRLGHDVTHTDWHDFHDGGFASIVFIRSMSSGPVFSIFWLPSGLAQVWITPRVPNLFCIAGSLK